MNRIVVCRGALVAVLWLPIAAFAQMAQTSKWVNLRAGPALDYPLVAQLAPATPLSVQGCVTDYSWCDVITADNLRGWVYAGNLLYPYQYSEVPLLTYGPTIGLPIITFSIGPYWSRHYRDRPWYGQEPQWAHRPPRHRPPPPHLRPPGEWPYPPGARPPGERPHPPAARPPRERPPGVRPPGERLPGVRPPGERLPGVRPPGERLPGVRPPGVRPPDARPPERPGRPPNGAPPGAERPGRPPGAERPGQRPPGERPPGARPPQQQPTPGARARPGGQSGPERPNAGDRREQR